MVHLYTSPSEPITKANFFGLNSDSQLYTVVSQLRAILLTAFMLDYRSFLYFQDRLCSGFLAIVLYSSASTKQSFRAYCVNCHLAKTRQRNVTNTCTCTCSTTSLFSYSGSPLLWLPTDKICCGLLLTKLSLLKIKICVNLLRK